MGTDSHRCVHAGSSANAQHGFVFFYKNTETELRVSAKARPVATLAIRSIRVIRVPTNDACSKDGFGEAQRLPEFIE